MEQLAKKDCQPCKGGMLAMKKNEAKQFFHELGNAWQMVNHHHLQKAYDFGTYRECLDFLNIIGELAELQNHHPDIYLSWGQVEVSIWTHKVDGLTESDFILAAKIEQLFQDRAPGKSEAAKQSNSKLGQAIMESLSKVRLANDDSLDIMGLDHNMDSESLARAIFEGMHDLRQPKGMRHFKVHR